VNIFITAANGFLGSNLFTALLEQGHQVTGSVRRLPKDNLSYKILALDDDPPISIFDTFDLVIHAAHDFDTDLKRAATINIGGTKNLFNLASMAGVKRQIYISSYSANPIATSSYGKIKYELEQFFLERGQTAIRPGLVVGPGGLCYKNIKKILATPIMPLIDKGQDFLPLISLDNFTSAMLKIIEHDLVGDFNLFNSEITTLKDFINTVNQSAHHKSFYINISSNFLLKINTFANKVGLRLPLNIENIQGLKKNGSYAHNSHLGSLVSNISTLEAMIKSVVSFREHSASCLTSD